jgi:polygalacturonase
MYLRLSSIALALLVTAALDRTALSAPTLPNINTNNVIVVTNATYGAKGDGVMTNTTAIQNAINAASAGGTTNGLSGGTVEIPAGVFLCGPLTFKSSVNLQLDAGAILQLLPFGSYPGFPYTNSLSQPSDFITGSSLHDIEISGWGAIDGQGALWWPGYQTNNRPTMISFSTCNRVLFQNATFSNSPAQNISIKGNNAGNVTIQRITVTAPSSSLPASQASHNTDAIDLAETNGLIQNCNLSVGDDNVALGSSAGLARDIIITNCAFGTGHGVSIGSFTASGVSNVTVINCTFNGTDNPIRMKSDNNLHGSSKGGLVQNLSYLNLSMTNVNNAAIMIYSYYNVVGTPTSISPATAAGETVDAVGSFTPIWRNITISNVTATVAGSGIAGIIWGRTEMPVTNIVLSHVNITASKTFDVYNAYGIQFLDSKITTTSSSQKTLTLWNAGVIASNSASGAGVMTIDGMNVNSGLNSLALYNSQAAMTFTNALGENPIKLSGATLTVSNDLFLPNTTTLNFTLGTSNSTVVTTGNLTLYSPFNITNGNGFGPGSYTLFNYGGGLSGAPVLGATPATGHAYLYTLDTNTAGRVNFIVATPPPPVFSSVILNNGTNLIMNGSGGTTNFSYLVLSSTNIALPLNQWTSIATNQFLANGNSSFTNSLATNQPQKFFLLQYP